MDQTLPMLFHLALDVKLALGSLLIAVSLILCVSFLAKPGILMGEPGTKWGDICHGKALLFSSVIRVVGLLIGVGGSWYGVTIFQKTREIPRAAEDATTASTSSADRGEQILNVTNEEEEHNAVLAEIRKIAGDQYRSVDSLGKKFFVWTEPSTKDVRVLETNDLIAGPTDDQNRKVYDPSDLPALVAMAHQQRVAAYQAEYPLMAWEECQNDVIPTLIGPANDTDPLIAARTLFDPPPYTAWPYGAAGEELRAAKKSPRFLFYVNPREGRAARFVRRSTLERWGKDPKSLFPVAIKNLERMFIEKRNDFEKENKGNVLVLTDSEGILTTYPVSPNFYTVFSKAAKGENFFFTLPTLTNVCILPSSMEGYIQELITVSDQLSVGRTPISTSIFLATPKEIKVYKMR